MDFPEQRTRPKSEQARELQTQLAQLRIRTHAEMRLLIEKRMKENPIPTEEELVMGVFEEEIEPQVRNAVKILNHKGYITESSGFYGHTDQYQAVDGFFQLDDETIEELAKNRVSVERMGPSYTLVKFYPENADIQDIKSQWDKIADIIPPSKKPSYISMSGSSEEFRKKYSNPHDVERLILERKLAHAQLPPDYPDRTKA